MASTEDVAPHRNGTVPVFEAQGDLTSSLHTRPTVADLQGENHYAELARKYWLKPSKPPKVNTNVVKEELWGRLEKDGFPYGSLLILETLQVLERYLWPGYSQDSTDSHVLLLAVIVNVKCRENLPSWQHFVDRPSEFSSFFRRVLSLTVDLSIPLNIRTHLLCFVIAAFHSLDNGLVRKECAPLVSISIWHSLHNDGAREEKLNNNVMLRKAWRSSGRRFDSADKAGRVKMTFERAWLYTLLLDFLDRLYDPASGDAGQSNLLYCERFVELLIDLESQLPTRRYVNALLLDMHILPAVKLSPIYNNEVNGLLRDLWNLLRHYAYFPIDDQSGQQFSLAEHHQEHSTRIVRLQRIGFKTFQSKLKLLALSNYGALRTRSDLQSHFEGLDTEEIMDLCKRLGLRTEYPTSANLVLDRSFFLEVLIFAHEARPTFQESARELTIMPTEHTLYEATFLRNENYTGARPLAIPKLNLQYLTIGDFLWRSFILHRCETFYAVRKDIEDTIKRLKPRTVGATTRFDGTSRMALPISRPAIQDIAPPKVGELVPAQVRAEVILDVYRLHDGVRREWESLRPNDVIFLAAVRPLERASVFMNGNRGSSEADRIGLRCLRGAEVIQVQDEKGRPIRERQNQPEDEFDTRRPKQRRLVLKLDPIAFHEDRAKMARTKQDVYESINLVIRRRSRENNFKPILESIRRLTLSDVPAPSWFQEVFLGYGNPTSASYKNLSNRLKSIDFRDTFLDWLHLVESFPGQTIEPSEEMESSFGPPYVLEMSSAETVEPDGRPSKKRRREQGDESTLAVKCIKVSTYKPPNTGPYPMDAPKLNAVRFTPAQIEAIASGTQPGLTVIVGPPGTGKTDVATQIINNIYHNFPNQRTLLVAHSNQALNQLFQKIIALDIDERHLLRLGHGEEELESDSSYSKFGRVESFLERGSFYLGEVTRLAASLGAPGAHGNSCETADYFNAVYVKPTWSQYWDSVQSSEWGPQAIMEAFPFYHYFSNAPQPLFPQDATKDQVVDVLTGCYRHIEKIFSELADIRPFEILRNSKDKANYLLVKEARVIAMTSTHAAMRRHEIAELGFHYDNVIMEESAQITEIETFIPLALQKPQDSNLPLQRIVLVGDHLQNSPVIQNLAFRQYANLEQSLFLRLVRLGVPTITLDQQARARPSIAALYQWRYPSLSSLPSVTSQPAFLAANPGFRYDYQFINVEDYNGVGESEPSPHFIQNLGEAEYAVALYQYMRLLGYPAHKISILAMYAGQKALIRDVLAHRCKGNPLFGLPKGLWTVDKYQGEQNDFIILSLTRTLRPGYIRDLRRLTVALSRARLGLYVLGRKALFEEILELKPAFELLFARPANLMLVANETVPVDGVLINRSVDEEEVPGTTEMVSVQHLGKWVFEMTQARIGDLRDKGGDIIVEEERPWEAEEDGEPDAPVVDEAVEEGSGEE